MQGDYLDAIFVQPVDAAAEVNRFADDHRADAELPHQAAAIPAWRQRGDHDFVAIAALAAGAAESVGFAVERKIIFLDAPIVAAPYAFSLGVEKGRAAGNAGLA